MRQLSFPFVQRGIDRELGRPIYMAFGGVDISPIFRGENHVVLQPIQYAIHRAPSPVLQINKGDRIKKDKIKCK